MRGKLSRCPGTIAVCILAGLYLAARPRDARDGEYPRLGRTHDVALHHVITEIML